MKRTVTFAFVVFLSLLMVSCASAPHWSGTEAQTGEFVWSYAPGIRFYINVVLVGGLFVYLTFVAIQTLRNWQKGEGGVVGCLSVLLLFIALALWANIREYIWSESFSINQDRIQHTSYPGAWKTVKQMETLEWKNVKYINYNPHRILESTTWVKVTPITRERVGKGQTEEGVKGRVLGFSENDDKHIEFVLEKQSYDTAYAEFIKTALSWIFGSEDYAVAPVEEARLKMAINKYLPENVKQAANAETKEYLSK